MSKPYKRLTVQIPNKIYERLDADAEANHRSLSSQVVAILQRHYEMTDKGVSFERVIYHTN